MPPLAKEGCIVTERQFSIMQDIEEIHSYTARLNSLFFVLFGYLADTVFEHPHSMEAVKLGHTNNILNTMHDNVHYALNALEQLMERLIAEAKGNPSQDSPGKEEGI